MNLKQELNAIDQFFDSISDEELSNMLIECGAGRILPTEKIIEEQELSLFSLYQPYHWNSKEFFEYINYNDGIERIGAA